MKVYIASRFENAPAVRALAAKLPEGWTWAYDWTGHTFADDPAEVACADYAGVVAADAVIVLLPGGPGTHTELGLALGMGKPLCVVGDAPRKDPRWPRCPFYLLGARAENEETALVWLRDLFPAT